MLILTVFADEDKEQKSNQKSNQLDNFGDIDSICRRGQRAEK